MSEIIINNQFVKKSGDEMFGNLNLSSGTDVLPQFSGTSDLGSSLYPFNNIYGNTGNFETINANNLEFSGNSVIVSGNNLGNGITIFNDKNGNNLEFNTLNSAGTISLTVNNNLITISGNALINISGVSPIVTTGDTISILSGSSTENGYISSGDWSNFNSKQNALGFTPINKSGDTNIGNLVGSGFSGTTLSGNSATISSINSNSINISGNAVIIGATNLGNGSNIYASELGNNLQFNTLSGTGTVTISENNNLITISGASSIDISLPQTTIDMSVVTWSGSSASGLRSTDVIIDASNNVITTSSFSGNSFSGNNAVISTINANSINVSGNSVIVSGTNLGTGFDIFNSKLGNNLQFNSISGAGSIIASISNNVITISGVDAGTGDVNGPVSSTINAIATWSGTNGNQLLNTKAIVDIFGNIITPASFSGTNFSGNNAVFLSNVEIGNNPSALSNNTLSVYGATNYGVIAVQSNSTSGESSIGFKSLNDVNNTSWVLGKNIQNTSGSFTIWYNDINRVYITTAGNVGIGTANPSQLLEISGNTLVDNTLFASVISGTTISGNSINVSGNSVIASGTNLGTGFDIFNSKLGNNLQFNTISGAGSVTLSSIGNLITVSGVDSGTGNVNGPATSTINAIATWSGTNGNNLLNTIAFIDSFGNISTAGTISGTFISGNNISLGSNSAIIQSTSGNSSLIIESSGTTSSILFKPNNLEVFRVSGNSLLIASGNSIQFSNSGISNIGSSNTPSNTVFSNLFSGNLASISTLNSNSIFISGNSVIVSGTNLGNGVGIYAGNIGTNNEFNSLSGVGNVNISLSNNIITISGSSPQQINVPNSTTDTAIVTWSGTTGSGLRNNFATIDSFGNISTMGSISGTYHSGTGFFIGGNSPIIQSTSGNSSLIISSSGSTSSIIISPNNLEVFRASGSSLLIASGANILVSNSGISNIGSSSNPFNTIFSNLFSGNAADISIVNSNSVNVSGNSTITSATNLGTGFDIFNSKLGNNLQFNTISGAGSVILSSNGTLITVSGVDSGTGDVNGPATSTINAIATWSGTNGNQLLNTEVIIDNFGNVITPASFSGTNFSGNTISVNSINVSGNSVITSATNIGLGLGVFSSKLGNNLQFNSISGTGSVVASILNNVITISGVDSGTGDVNGPATSTINAIATWSGTNGNELLNTLALIDNFGNISTMGSISGTYHSGTGFFIGSNSPTIQSVSGNSSLTIAASGSTSSILFKPNNLEVFRVSGNSLLMASGNSVLVSNSGISNIGSSSSPFNATFSNLFSGNIADISTINSNSINISGNSVIVSGNNLGTGFDIFNSKLGNNLQFNTISGAGSVILSSNGNIIMISGVDSGTGNVNGPVSSTINAIATWSGTNGNELLNTLALIDNFGNISTMGSISGTFISGNTFSVGSGGIVSQTSGTENIGSSSSPFNTIFSNTFSGTNVISNTFSGTNIVIAGNLTTTLSGINNIGSSNDPFNNIYAKSLNVQGSTNVAWSFNEVPSGLINNINTTYTLVSSPINNSLELELNGILINESGINSVGTSDYTLSGNTISMFYAPEIGSSLIATYLYSVSSGTSFIGTYIGTISGISGPTSTTQNAITIWNNSTGTAVANSNITIDSNGDLLNTSSGTQNIGTLNSPFNNIYANNFINTNIPSMLTFSGASSKNSNGSFNLMGPGFSTGSAISFSTNSTSGTYCTLNINGIYSVTGMIAGNASTATYLINANSFNLALSSASPWNGFSGTLCGCSNVSGGADIGGETYTWTGYLPSGTLIYNCGNSGAPTADFQGFTICLVTAY